MYEILIFVLLYVIYWYSKRKNKYEKIQENEPLPEPVKNNLPIQSMTQNMENFLLKKNMESKEKIISLREDNYVLLYTIERLENTLSDCKNKLEKSLKGEELSRNKLRTIESQNEEHYSTIHDLKRQLNRSEEKNNFLEIACKQLKSTISGKDCEIKNFKERLTKVRLGIGSDGNDAEHPFSSKNNWDKEKLEEMIKKCIELKTRLIQEELEIKDLHKKLKKSDGEIEILKKMSRTSHKEKIKLRIKLDENNLQSVKEVFLSKETENKLIRLEDENHHLRLKNDFLEREIINKDRQIERHTSEHEREKNNSKQNTIKLEKKLKNSMCRAKNSEKALLDMKEYISFESQKWKSYSNKMETDISILSEDLSVAKYERDQALSLIDVGSISSSIQYPTRPRRKPAAQTRSSERPQTRRNQASRDVLPTFEESGWELVEEDEYSNHPKQHNHPIHKNSSWENEQENKCPKQLEKLSPISEEPSCEPDKDSQNSKLTISTFFRNSSPISPIYASENE